MKLYGTYGCFNENWERKTKYPSGNLFLFYWNVTNEHAHYFKTIKLDRKINIRNEIQKWYCLRIRHEKNIIIYTFECKCANVCTYVCVCVCDYVRISACMNV